MIRRRWRPIALLAILFAGLGAASAAVAEDAAPPPVPVTRYDSCHTMLIDTAIPGDVPQWDVRNLPQLAERMTQGAIPQAVAVAVSDDLATVQSRVRVGVRNDIQSIAICAVGETPGGSEALADAYASQTITSLENDAVDFHRADIESARGQIVDAQACVDGAEAGIEAAGAGADISALTQQASLCELQLSQARSKEISLDRDGIPVVPLETLSSAEAVEISEWDFDRRVREGAAGTNVAVGIEDSIGTARPASGSNSAGRSIPDGPVVRALAGWMLGAALGFAFVQFTERLDSRLRRKEDVEETLDLPVLAEIPPLARRDRKQTRLISVDEPRSRSAESFRALRSAVDYAQMIQEERGMARAGAQVILVTSSGPSEGKTTSLANLAAVMAEGDRTVLAVNCDFRRPRLHRYLGGATDPQRLNVTSIPGVQMVTQVTPADADATPSDVVAAQRRLIERARDRFDVILLDTAPVLTTNDAAELLSVADHVILVVNAGQTKAEAAARAAELLERRGKPPLGVALVGTRDVPNSSEYYYSDDDPYLVQSKRKRADRTRKDRFGSDSEPESESDLDSFEVQANG
jgi:Mrp family chromosome partitioning ATPase